MNELLLRSLAFLKATNRILSHHISCNCLRVVEKCIYYNLGCKFQSAIDMFGAAYIKLKGKLFKNTCKSNSNFINSYSHNIFYGIQNWITVVVVMVMIDGGGDGD